MPSPLTRRFHSILRTYGIEDPFAQALAKALATIYRQMHHAALRSLRQELRQTLMQALPANLVTKEDIKLLIELFNRRFEDLIHHTDKRFEAMNQRFEDMNRRFEDLHRQIRIIQWLIGVGWTILATLLSILLWRLQQ